MEDMVFLRQWVLLFCVAFLPWSSKAAPLHTPHAGHVLSAAVGLEGSSVRTTIEENADDSQDTQQLLSVTPLSLFSAGYLLALNMTFSNSRESSGVFFLSHLFLRGPPAQL